MALREERAELPARTATQVSDAIGVEHPYTAFQWYFSRARNTVYWGAFITEKATFEAFRDLVFRLTQLAPQLNWRQDDRRMVHIDARPFPIEDIIEFRTVRSFAGYPDSEIQANTDLFEDPRLPCFRASCHVLADDVPGGNRGFIQFRFSHALMEGVDAALLLRARESIHELSGRKQGGGRALARALAYVAAGLLTPGHFAMAALHGRKPETFGLKTLTLARADIKRVCAGLGVQQRSLLFALVMFGLYHSPAGGKPSTRPRIAAYSRLKAKRVEGDDDYLRLRMHLSLMRARPTFEAYVKRIDERLQSVGPESLGFQMHYNAVLALHKGLSRGLPFLYGRRFFHYIPYDFVLSLVPPQINEGEFAHFGFNDIYLGSHTPGVNCCVMVPQQDRFSFNIYGEREILDRIGGIEALIAQYGIASVGSSRVDLQACKLEYSIVSPK